MATLDGKQLKNGTVTAAKVASDVLVTNAARSLDSGVITVSGTGDIIVPTTPLTSTSVVNKSYVDAIAQGLQPKAAVKAATAAALPGTVSYAVPNVISCADASLGSIDTSVTLVVGDRLLVKNQASGQYNGIYVVTTTEVGSYSLTRSADADNTPDGEVAAGMYCFVLGGTANGRKGFSLITPDPIVLNTTVLTFSVFSQSGDLTLAAVGSSPNASAATLSGQQLNLELASTTYPGLITAAQFDKLAATSGSNTGDVTLGTLGTGTDAKGATISSQVISMQAASAGGPGLMSASDFSKLAGISGTNTGDQALRSDMRGLTASVTSADYNQATATTVTAANTHGGEVAVFVNGQKQFVGDGTRAADCYFGASSATARAFAAIVATDKLYWVGSVAGFQLAASDKIDVLFMP